MTMSSTEIEHYDYEEFCRSVIQFPGNVSLPNGHHRQHMVRLIRDSDGENFLNIGPQTAMLSDDELAELVAFILDLPMEEDT